MLDGKRSPEEVSARGWSISPDKIIKDILTEREKNPSQTIPDRNTNLPSQVYLEEKAPVVETHALAPDERKCPACSKTIKKQALKCRHCGEIFDCQLRTRSREVPAEIEQEVRQKANSALIRSRVGIFFFGVVLGPSAISRGTKTLKLLNEYPECTGSFAARAKAIAGISLGALVFLLWFSGIIANMSR